MKRVLFLAWILMSIHVQARQYINNSTSLYLQTDKHIYTPSERIWFTGFMLNLDTTVNYHTLYVSLFDPILHKPVVTEKFILSLGVCYGMLDLPDSLHAGDYPIVAFTNNYLLDSVEQEFHQWISVRRPGQTPYLPTPVRGFKTHLTERMIEECKPKAVIQGDSAAYHQRSKTKWMVQIQDEDGRPVRGTFSISCVLTNRLRQPSSWNIRRFYYIDQHTFANQQPINTGPHDVHPISGYVLKGKKEVSKSIPMLLMTSSNAVPFQTSKKGTFKLKAEQVVASWNTDAFLSIAKGNNSSNFKIVIWDDQERIVNNLAKVNYPYEVETGPDSLLFTDKELQHMDLVLHHSDSLSPPAIQLLMGASDQEYMKKVKPAYLPVAFPLVDYSRDSTFEQNLNTTLYWNYQLTTDEDGKAEFSFFTGDLPGDYTCLIQGMTARDYFVSRATFKVL